MLCPSVYPNSRNRFRSAAMLRAAVAGHDAHQRHCRLLRARTPHFDGEQQAGTTDQGGELTPCHVGHGPSSCGGVTTSNRRDPIVRSTAAQRLASPWARPELF
jgi:hypothetical protein